MATTKKKPKPSAETEAPERNAGAAATDAARLEATVQRRNDLRDAQKLEQGEKDRQKARAAISKAQETQGTYPAS